MFQESDPKVQLRNFLFRKGPEEILGRQTDVCITFYSTTTEVRFLFHTINMKTSFDMKRVKKSLGYMYLSFMKSFQQWRTCNLLIQLTSDFLWEFFLCWRTGKTNKHGKHRWTEDRLTLRRQPGIKSTQNRSKTSWGAESMHHFLLLSLQVCVLSIRVSSCCRQQKVTTGITTEYNVSLLHLVLTFSQQVISHSLEVNSHLFSYSLRKAL